MNNPTPSHDDVENAFQGNICRCTGYRPIFEAMHTFAKCDDEGCEAHGELAQLGGDHEAKLSDEAINEKVASDKPVFLKYET